MKSVRKGLALALVSGCLALFGVMGHAQALVITTTYTDTDQQNFGVLGDQILEFNVTNATGVTWTDFHVASLVIGPLGAGSYVGPGTPVFSSLNFVLDIFDLNVADGDTLNFSVDYVCGIAEACGLGNVIGAFPTVADNGGGNGQIPEPGTLALFAIGLLGLMLALRRRAA